MKMRKCSCGEYTLKEKCPKCGAETGSAHHKFSGLRDVIKTRECKNHLNA